MNTHKIIQNPIMSVTFAVDNVAPTSTSFPCMSEKEVVSRFAQNVNSEIFVRENYKEEVVVAWNPLGGKKMVKVGRNLHGFVSAVKYAFDNHLPLTLRPDDFWLLILETVSLHVEKNAKVLQSKYVNFEGKTRIHLHRPGFELAQSSGEQWRQLFQDFETKIKALTKPRAFNAFSKNYSTTTRNDVIARSLSMMSIFESYFNYSMSTFCGFPKITLEGTKSDWESLIRDVRGLESLLMPEFASTWLPAVTSCLDHAVKAFDGQIDVLFWGSMLKYQSTRGSGSDTYFNGWLLVFFPYLDDQVHHLVLPWNELQKRACENRLNIASRLFGIRYSSAPVEVVDNFDEKGETVKLTFKAGFVGAELTEDNSIRPCVSWAVLQVK